MAVVPHQSSKDILKSQETMQLMFYMCRSCKSPLVYHACIIEEDPVSIMFYNVGNIKSLFKISLTVLGRWVHVIDVLCKGCNTVLGRNILDNQDKKAAMQIVEGGRTRLDRSKIISSIDKDEHAAEGKPPKKGDGNGRETEIAECAEDLLNMCLD